MASMFIVVRSNCSLGLLSPPPPPPIGPHFQARCICCLNRWKLLVRTCRACCLICNNGEDDVDVAERAGDDGAECTLDSLSSLNGDPAPGVAIGLSCSAAPLARCSEGDGVLPVSTVPGSSRDSETDVNSSPSIAARPDDEADGKSYVSASLAPAGPSPCDLHTDGDEDGEASAAASPSPSRHATGDAEAVDASSIASSKASGCRGDLPSPSACLRGPGASEAASSPGSSSMRAGDRSSQPRIGIRKVAAI
jgi:hypothetical protein